MSACIGCPDNVLLPTKPPQPIFSSGVKHVDDTRAKLDELTRRVEELERRLGVPPSEEWVDDRPTAC